uniref:(northern house mosquito) hypothetical protein n=1 Tax=Culex pipiens TaxID=7175 RepID=A0A8D8DQC2_CULPI
MTAGVRLHWSSWSTASMAHDAGRWLLTFVEVLFCFLADIEEPLVWQRPLSSTPSDPERSTGPSAEWMILRCIALLWVTSRKDSLASRCVGPGAAVAHTAAGSAGLPNCFPMTTDVPISTVGSSQTCASKGSTLHVRRFSMALLFRFLPL